MNISKPLSLMVLLLAVGFMAFPINDTFAEHSQGLLKVTTDKKQYDDNGKIFIIGSGGIEFKSYIAIVTAPDYVSVASEAAIADGRGQFYTFVNIRDIHDEYYGNDSPPLNGTYTISVRGNSYDDDHLYEDLADIVIGKNLVFNPSIDIAEISTDKLSYNTRDILTLDGTLEKYPSPFVLFSISDSSGYEVTIESARLDPVDYTFSTDIDLYGLKLNQFGLPTFLDYGEHTIKVKNHKYYDPLVETKFNVGYVVKSTESNNMEFISQDLQFQLLQKENEALKKENESLQSIIDELQNTINTIFKLIEQLN